MAGLVMFVGCGCGGGGGGFKRALPGGCYKLWCPGGG